MGTVVSRLKISPPFGELTMSVGRRSNVAVKFLFPFMVRVTDDEVPVTAPDHPEKTDPEPGVAVSLTSVPAS